MKREIVTARLVIENNDGEIDQELTVDGYVHYYVDTNYGADADGKHGYKKTIVEDVTNVAAQDVYGEDVKLSDKDLDLAKEALTTKFLEG